MALKRISSCMPHLAHCDVTGYLTKILQVNQKGGEKLTTRYDITKTMIYTRNIGGVLARAFFAIQG